MKVTELSQAQSNFSDIYKDVNGVRPRWQSVDQWNSLEWLQEQIAGLCVRAEIQEIEDRERERVCVLEFEAKVLEIIALGASDRETAIKWLFDAEQLDYSDRDYFCYKSYLPSGYLN